MSTPAFSVSRVFRLLPLVALISACGGGSDSTDTAGPSTSAASQPLTQEGAVADGYLQGATVCFDLNRNGRCDSDEPSTLSGVDGRYSLARPAGAEAAPIVAEVPATAIDQDTGQPLGKEVVFSAPAAKPDFVSPITTMIVDAMSDNGLLSVDEAEAQIAGTLGLDANGSVSLFSDYVSQGRSDEDYRFIHQTARVVTAVMHDIRQQIQTEAQKAGLDAINNGQIQQRAQSLIRQEVRASLPTVVAQVVQAVANGATPESLSVGNIASSISNGLKDRLAQQTAERLSSEQRRVGAADMQAVLLDGMFELDYDCEASVQTPADRHGLTERDQAFNDCYPVYQKISLPNRQSTELSFQSFAIDGDSWVERDARNRQSLLLQNGAWSLVSDQQRERWSVSRIEGNTLVMSNPLGESIQVQALQVSTSGQSLLLHGDSELFLSFLGLTKTQASNSVFPANSLMYRIKITHQSASATLSVDQDNSACIDYGDNCNVVRDNSQQPLPITSLADILSGVKTPQVSLDGQSYQLRFGQDDGSGQGTLSLNAVDNGQRSAQSHSGRWQRLEHNGLGLTLLKLPRTLRHRLALESNEHYFLAEQAGFVRLGQYHTAGSSQTITTFNSTAFDFIATQVSNAWQAKTTPPR